MRWDQRYGGNSGGARGMTAIERREQEMQITTVVPTHHEEGQQQGQQQGRRVAAAVASDVVVLKPLRASLVNDDTHSMKVHDNKEATGEEEMRNAQDPPPMTMISQVCQHIHIQINFQNQHVMDAIFLMEMLETTGMLEEHDEMTTIKESWMLSHGRSSERRNYSIQRMSGDGR